MKEMIRKFLVSLKKNPQVIPLLAHTVAFGIFSLNLTDISNTTAKIYGAHMGLCSFATMLFSILAYVCMFSRSTVSDSLGPRDCIPPGFSVHEIFQARIVERVAISSSRGSLTQ